MIQVNITIDLHDGIPPDAIISSIQEVISQINNNQTRINVNQVDNPLSLSPVSAGKIGDSEE